MRNINTWINIQFESSTYLTEQFSSFARAYKKALVETLGNEFELVNWMRGHFYISAFFKNKATGKMIYIACPDVRFFPNEWYSNILLRTAEHEKDYTGGGNTFTTLDRLSEDAMRLIERR